MQEDRFSAKYIMVPRIRRALKRIYPLRSAYYFALTLKDRVRFAKSSLDAEMRREFKQPDPWNYLQNQGELERFHSALDMLDAARKGHVYERAMEIGCAEGIFTEMLATRCQSLLSVDIDRSALARAAERCAGNGVTFSQWDLTESPFPGTPDLLVVMDVLEYFFRPADVRNARDKLVSALSPGGHLLLGNSRQNPMFETAWWGKRLLRGGKRIAEFFCEHPRLELISMETGEFYVNAIFRIRDDDRGATL
jgi:2-polyprenyl-3-methyl-5-hydroxy-6-metoxy-1,4-benzoquinol methylase